MKVRKTRSWITGKKAYRVVSDDKAEQVDNANGCLAIVILVVLCVIGVLFFKGIALFQNFLDKW